MEMHLRIARALTEFLENKFSIGRFKFGFDPIIGVIPGFGDLVTTVISLYIVWIGIQMRLSQQKIIEMVGNVLVDFLIGLFPIIGDLTDAVFKANSRNMKILEQHLSNIIEGEIVR